MVVEEEEGEEGEEDHKFSTMTKCAKGTRRQRSC